MIVCIEGPDRSGKTTLLKPIAEALNAQAITRLETSKEAAKCWPYIEPVYLHLLEQLMNKDQWYVTDRSMTVSAQVYGAVFNRPVLINPVPWLEREIIVYVETPIDVLKQRWYDEGCNNVFPIELYDKVIVEYKRVLKDYTVVTVDGTQDVESSVKQATNEIRLLTQLG